MMTATTNLRSSNKLTNELEVPKSPKPSRLQF